MADWPDTLPCTFDLGSFDEEPQIDYDEFRADHGRPLRAVKYTGFTLTKSGEMKMTNAQFATFLTFFRYTLNKGVERFNMNNRITNHLAGICMINGWRKIETTPRTVRIAIEFEIWTAS